MKQKKVLQLHHLKLIPMTDSAFPYPTPISIQQKQKAIMGMVSPWSPPINSIP